MFKHSPLQEQQFAVPNITYPYLAVIGILELAADLASLFIHAHTHTHILNTRTDTHTDIHA